jgi:hypothetical protein
VPHLAQNAAPAATSLPHFPQKAIVFLPSESDPERASGNRAKAITAGFAAQAALCKSWNGRYPSLTHPEVGPPSHFQTGTSGTIEFARHSQTVVKYGHSRSVSPG